MPLNQRHASENRGLGLLPLVFCSRPLAWICKGRSLTPGFQRHVSDSEVFAHRWGGLTPCFQMHASDSEAFAHRCPLVFYTFLDSFLISKYCLFIEHISCLLLLGHSMLTSTVKSLTCLLCGSITGHRVYVFLGSLIFSRAISSSDISFQLN